ncbi:MAG: helix-turn-helix domain-containing protein [Chthoniobacterales bacterium]
MTYFSQMAAPPDASIPIAFLGFDGFLPLDLTGPLEAFAAVRCDHGASSRYQSILVGVTGKTFTARSGATFKAKYTLETAPVFDTIIIPGGVNLATSETNGLIANWLRARAQTTRRFASVATGIYPLAQSGLLDGRRVTTHWRHAQYVARTFRHLQVDDAASFIKDDRFYTSGGGTAGIEMSLALIREDYGSIAAINVARELVMNLRPASEGGRPIDPAEYQPGIEDRLAELPAWITSRLRANLSVEVLAERACLCPRHFTRLFKRAFQSTPAHFVEQLRINEAERRLASQRLSIGSVAASVGFKSTDVFRRAFERRFGMAPSSYRKRSRPDDDRSATNRPKG